ncbi:hypothetical protein CJ030_MR7G028087, partial [Morella rubra]
LAPCQLAPNGWRFLLGFICIWKERFPNGPTLSPQEFLHFYRLCEVEGQDGWWYFINRGSKFIFSSHPTSNKGWKEKFFFAFGVGWRATPDIKDVESIYNTWGIPSVVGPSIIIPEAQKGKVRIPNLSDSGPPYFVRLAQGTIHIKSDPAVSAFHVPQGEGVSDKLGVRLLEPIAQLREFVLAELLPSPTHFKNIILTATHSLTRGYRGSSGTNPPCLNGRQIANDWDRTTLRGKSGRTFWP